MASTVSVREFNEGTGEECWLCVCIRRDRGIAIHPTVASQQPSSRTLSSGFVLTERVELHRAA
jgi:hypothetical protein